MTSRDRRGQHAGLSIAPLIKQFEMGTQVSLWSPLMAFA